MNERVSCVCSKAWTHSGDVNLVRALWLTTVSEYTVIVNGRLLDVKCEVVLHLRNARYLNAFNYFCNQLGV